MHRGRESLTHVWGSGGWEGDGGASCGEGRLAGGGCYLVMMIPFMTGVVNAGHSGHLQGSGALLGKTEGSESFLAGGTQEFGKVTGRVCGQGVYHGGACRSRELECSARVSPLAPLLWF